MSTDQILKCCKICGAFSTCDHKGECCPECSYFDEKDYLCLAPEQMKKEAKAKKKPVIEELDEGDDVDPETFLFEDDDEEEEEVTKKSGDDSVDEDLNFDDDWN
ncbi:MAG: hypothetical protein RTU30_12025 [Candidatus Thorarchaeota archaeon]